MLVHEQKLNRICKFLKERKSKAPLTLKKKSVSHQVPKPKDKRFTDEKLDVSDLNDILLIDPEKRICVAEPGVTFFDLVNETLKYDLAPMIVPEHKQITVGGAVAGCSIESMSYKYGGFHDSCLEYEVVTAKGDVITVSPTKNSLIFQMMHGTFGTLGIITKLKFRLIPVKKFVKMNYERYSNFRDYRLAIFKHYKNKDVDFMDGIIHSPNEYVLSVGNFVDDAPYTNSYNWIKSYFLSTKKRKEDYLKTVDYYWRYDKGITSAKPFLIRLLFGKMLGSTTTLRLAQTFHKIIPPSIIPITVDVFVPFSKSTEFMNWYKKEINHFPLWCVPYKRMRNYEWISDELFKKAKDELYLDLAIYNMKRKNPERYYRMLEEKLMQIGGLKTLISNNFYTEEEFWQTWNKKNYDKVKKIMDPDNILRDLYDKTCKAARGL